MTIGKRVKVVKIIDTEGDHLLSRIGEIGIVTHIQVEFPFAGSVRVRFADGEEDMFWAEEVEETE